MTESGPSKSKDSTSFFRNRSFWGLTISQLLGAFNDNMFKQLVLLLCLEKAREIAQATGGPVSDRYQPIAMAVFAIPWILFSGVSGFLADRFSKRRIVVLCKSMEIVVMGCGLLAFLSGQLWALFVVLFLMSAQSTVFGPAKFGILPEQFRSEDLPRINGIFQMTTFLAIIFGFASAGILKEALPGQEGLALVSVVSIVIAVVGTGAACLVRPTPVAQPDLKLTWQAAGIDGQNWKLIQDNRFLLGVLLVSSLFWFVGGVVQPSVNSFGEYDLKLSSDRIGILQACMGVGIAFGCVMSGRLSKNRIRFGLVRAGMLGMVVGFPALTAISYFQPGVAASTKQVAAEVAESGSLIFDASTAEWLARGFLIWLGGCAGFFAVPLQVALQSVPPESQKGRMIGTMNLVNWFGILLSAVFYGAFEAIRSALNSHGFELTSATVFTTLAVIAAIVAMIYRPDDIDLTDSAK
ncbi:MAG: MFS transporter [Planctomycetota bacterium]|nr:MFS transporter [Planctomycetota bacterium]MDA0919049.1 MFS transporter [Planctomycetota bacterium]MDA1158593.1 MFS transporter [Planctomycetota bacterium]